MRMLELLAVETISANELALGENVPSAALLSVAQSAGIHEPFTQNLDALKTEARRRLDEHLREINVKE